MNIETIPVVILKGVTTVHSYVTAMTIGSAIGGLRPGDMFYVLFVFILLLWILKKVAWGPLMKTMEEREKYVASEIEAAENSRKQAEKAAKEAAEQLQQTRQEAQAIIEEARQAAVRQEENIVQSAREEAERLKEAAKADIENEKEKAIQALQDQVASLSVLIASKVIEKELSAQDQEQLINDYIKEIGEEQ